MFPIVYINKIVFIPWPLIMQLKALIKFSSKTSAFKVCVEAREKFFSSGFLSNNVRFNLICTGIIYYYLLLLVPVGRKLNFTIVHFIAQKLSNVTPVLFLNTLIKLI